MRYIYYFLILFGLFSCATTKPTNMVEPRSEIRFGTGGGFMGDLTAYCVLSDGKIFQQQDFKITKINANQKEIDHCFATCKEIGFSKLSINDPGNTYAYIETKTGDQIHRVTWNPYQPNLPVDLVRFHNQLLELVGLTPLVAPPVEEADPNKSRLVQPEKAIFSKVKPVKTKKSPTNQKNAMKNKKQIPRKYKQ